MAKKLKSGEMFCPECGALIKKGTTVCPNCKLKIRVTKKTEKKQE